MSVHKVAVPPGVALRMCEDCRKEQKEYVIIERDVEGDCQHNFCENRDKQEGEEDE